MLSELTITSLLILGVVLVTSQLKLGRSVLRRRYKQIFTLSLLAIFLVGLHMSFLQYKLWSGGSFTKLLLPPHDSLGYFFFYVLTRIFAPYLISLGAAFLFLFAAVRYNRKYNEQFFEKEEPYLGALSIFLTGHPGWLIYMITVIILYLLSHVFYYIFISKKQRLPMYYFWVPTAIFVIIISGYWLYGMSILQSLKI